MNQHQRQTEARFFDLLGRYLSAAGDEGRHQAEAEIWREFGAERAVLVMDMSGFSQVAQRHGLVHYLSMVRRMHLTVRPIVEKHGGAVVKFQADDCFALFPGTLDAIHACIAINRAFDAPDPPAADEFRIRVSCGIDYGDLLLVGDGEFFGNPVNRASKLGEDVAAPGEILVTRSAMDRVGADAGIAFKPVRLTLSGIELDACSVVYR